MSKRRSKAEELHKRDMAEWPHFYRPLKRSKTGLKATKCKQLTELEGGVAIMLPNGSTEVVAKGTVERRTK